MVTNQNLQCHSIFWLDEHPSIQNLLVWKATRVPKRIPHWVSGDFPLNQSIEYFSNLQHIYHMSRIVLRWSGFQGMASCWGLIYEIQRDNHHPQISQTFALEIAPHAWIADSRSRFTCNMALVSAATKGCLQWVRGQVTTT